MQNIVLQWLSDENLEAARGKKRKEIFAIFGNNLMPVAHIPPEYLHYLDKDITDNLVYSGMGYFIDHVVNHHPNIPICEYLNMQDTISAADDVRLDYNRKSIIFVKYYDRYKAVVVNIGFSKNKKLVFHKSLFMQKKAPYTKLLSIRCTNSSLVDGISTISPVSKLTAAVSLSALNDDLDTTKVVNNFQNPKFLEQKEQKNLVKTIKPPPVRRGGRGL